MTPAQWKEIEQRLSHPYGVVCLLADGYKITAEVRRLKGMRYGIAVFIDGVIELKLCNDKEAVAPRKFWRARKNFLYSASRRAMLADQAKSRKFDKEYRAWCLESSTAHIVTMDPTWPSAAAFCRHLRKTCTHVERVESFDDAPAEVPA